MLKSEEYINMWQLLGIEVRSQILVAASQIVCSFSVLIFLLCNAKVTQGWFNNFGALNKPKIRGFLVFTIFNVINSPSIARLGTDNNKLKCL